MARDERIAYAAEPARWQIMKQYPHLLAQRENGLFFRRFLCQKRQCQASTDDDQQYFSHARDSTVNA
jgi:hypothetical protein